MHLPDLINGSLECLCAVMLALDVRAITRTKHVAGVSIGARGFFWAWSIWNLYWYSHLDQPFSLVGAIFVLIPQTAWIVLLVHYARRHLRA